MILLHSVAVLPILISPPALITSAVYAQTDERAFAYLVFNCKAQLPETSSYMLVICYKLIKTAWCNKL